MTCCPSAGPRAGPRSEDRRLLEVLIAGNPNSGKTTVFNALTGATARVGNYPGVTVDRRSATVDLTGEMSVQVVDLPGTYSLSARSPEEQVAVDAVLGRDGRPPDVVTVVADTTALSRSLYLVLCVVETGVPVVLALNMMDEARAAGMEIDAEKLSDLLGVEAVCLVASRREGLQALREAIERAARRPANEAAFRLPLSEALERDVVAVEAALGAPFAGSKPAARRAWALWALLSLGDDELVGVPDTLRAATAAVRARAQADGRDIDLEIVGARYAHIDAIVAEAAPALPFRASGWTERIDAVLTHPLSGFAIFLGVMVVVFEALFRWAEPAIAWIEDGIAAAQTLVGALMPPGPLHGLIVDGVIAGVGNVLVFIPQITLLFIFIVTLEDSGYLARVAFVLDRLMGGIGLHGKAFVPMLSGLACAVPAVMATRTIESRRDRLLTMMVIPLVSCSARLPVYVIVTAAVFDPTHTVLGFLSTGAAVLFVMYFLSVCAALTAAFVLRRTVMVGRRPALVLELPPYRRPILRNVLIATWQRVRSFVVDAGTIILAMTIILWALLAYPRSDEVTSRYDSLRAQAAQTSPAGEVEARLMALDDREAAEQLEHSIAGRIGHGLRPMLAPMGQDWRIGVGLLGAFAAREVFVSTLGTVFGMGEADEESEPLREALRSATLPDGRRLMTPLSGVALMVFFVLACQCMSTLAVIRRESGSWKWPAFVFGYMSVVAWLSAVLVYQVGLAMGWGVG